MIYIFLKHKGFALVKLLIAITAIIIFVSYMYVLPRESIYSGLDSLPPHFVMLSKLRNAKAACIQFLGDNTDMTFDQIVDVWSGLNVGNTSLDQYMEDPRRVSVFSFLVVPDPETSEKMLLVGIEVNDPEIASWMIDLTGATLFGHTGHAFTSTDSFVYLRVK